MTGLRSGEARQATWDEIDWSNSTWTVPADHMKAGIEHRVPLSTQAKEILHQAREQSWPQSGHNFFPPQTCLRRVHQFQRGSPNLLRRAGHVESVPHGFRSSLRTWAAEETDLPEPAAEMLLAHTPASAVVKAYQTSDFFKHRQPAMQQWADYLTQTMGLVISTTIGGVQGDTGRNPPCRALRRRTGNPPTRQKTREGWYQSIMPGWETMTEG